jgi:hypothetical protein
MMSCVMRPVRPMQLSNQDLFIVVINGKHKNSNYCEDLRKSFKSELLILNYDNRLWAHPQSNNEA